MIAALGCVPAAAQQTVAPRVGATPAYAAMAVPAALSAPGLAGLSSPSALSFSPSATALSAAPALSAAAPLAAASDNPGRIRSADGTSVQVTYTSGRQNPNDRIVDALESAAASRGKAGAGVFDGTAAKPGLVSDILAALHLRTPTFYRQKGDQFLLAEVLPGGVYRFTRKEAGDKPAVSMVVNRSVGNIFVEQYQDGRVSPLFVRDSGDPISEDGASWVGRFYLDGQALLRENGVEMKPSAWVQWKLRRIMARVKAASAVAGGVVPSWLHIGDFYVANVHHDSDYVAGGRTFLSATRVTRAGKYEMGSVGPLVPGTLVDKEHSWLEFWDKDANWIPNRSVVHNGMNDVREVSWGHDSDAKSVPISGRTQRWLRKQTKLFFQDAGGPARGKKKLGAQIAAH